MYIYACERRDYMEIIKSQRAVMIKKELRKLRVYLKRHYSAKCAQIIMTRRLNERASKQRMRQKQIWMKSNDLNERDDDIDNNFFVSLN